MIADPLSLNVTSLLTVAVVVLVIGLVLVFFKLRAIQAKAAESESILTSELKELKRDLSAITNADFGLGKRLIKVEHSINALADKQLDLLDEVQSGFDADFSNREDCGQVSGIQTRVDTAFEEMDDLSREEQALAEMFGHSAE